MHHKTALLNILLITLFAFLITSPASIVSAGTNVWTSNGPEGGIIYALAIDPQTPATLYAGTDGGVFAIQQVQPGSFAKLPPLPTVQRVLVQTQL